MKICILYDIPHHYRKGIWEKLSLDKDDEYYIYCDYIDKHSVKHINKNEIKYYNDEGRLKIYPILKNIYYKNVLVFQNHLLGIIFSEKYDKYIFLGHYYSLSTWISLLYLKLKKRPVFIWTHGAYGGEKKIKKMLVKAFYSLSDHLLLYGNYAKRILENDLKIKKKISVIYNSLDYENQISIRNKVYKKQPIITEKYLIFIGRIERRKRVDILIKAFKKLILDKKYSSLNLVIIGDGSLLDDLRQWFSSTNILFLGAIYEESIIANYLFNAELLVSPGHVGLNVIHSLTYGTPVITHNNFKHHAPEFEAIIPDKSGNFYLENSIDDLCEVIKNWLKNSKYRESIRNDCFNIIDNYWNPQYQYEIIKKAIQNG